MAFSIKITAQKDDGSKTEVEPKWWDKNELRKTYDFDLSLSNGYMDLKLSLDKTTLIEIYKDQEKRRNKGIYAFDDWIKINDKTHKELKELINKFENYQKVELLIFEW